MDSSGRSCWLIVGALANCSCAAVSGRFIVTMLLGIGAALLAFSPPGCTIGDVLAHRLHCRRHAHFFLYRVAVRRAHA